MEDFIFDYIATAQQCIGCLFYTSCFSCPLSCYKLYPLSDDCWEELIPRARGEQGQEPEVEPEQGQEPEAEPEQGQKPEAEPEQGHVFRSMQQRPMKSH